MQGISAVAGKDVVIIDGMVITALADGESIKLDFDTAIAQMKISKDGNSIYGMQYSGIIGKLSIRIVRGSYDDAILNSKLQQWLSDPTGFNLMSGSYVKRVGDGQGNVTSEIYQLAGGIFDKIPSGKTHSDGDTEQSVTVYTMLFRNNARLMQ